MKNVFRYGWIVAVVGYIVCSLAGLIFDRRELRSWKAEKASLEQIVGRIKVDDASKIHVFQAANDGPNNILWRVALPASQTWKFQINTPVDGGAASTWMQSEQQQLLVRCRIIKVDGRWTLFVARSQGSGSNGLVDRVGEFITEHWDELDVRSAGQEQQTDYGLDEVIPLLTVRVPERLLPTVESELGTYSVKQLETKPIVQIEFGTDTAFQLRNQAVQPLVGE